MALFSCKEQRIPKDVLTVDVMASILIDIHLAEGKIDVLKLHGDTARLVFNYFEKQVFEKHRVDRDSYKKSFEYHLDNMKTMDEIYSRVVDSLNVRKQVTRID